MEGNDVTEFTSKLFDLTGEVALVTGASSGLGRRFAEVLAGQGAKVVVAARRKERLDSLVEDIEKAGGTALAVSMDVTRQKDIAAAFDAAEKAFGPVTLLLNNAGLARSALITEQEPETWRAVMDTDLDAVLWVGREMARRLMAAEKPGTIINTASIAGYTVSKGLSAYHVAKAAVVQLTKVMALEFARFRIRVNAIAPGYILTEINENFLKSDRGQEMIKTIPMRRYGSEDELDGILLLLASSRASSFMTGSIVVADGGQLLGS